GHVDDDFLIMSCLAVLLDAQLVMLHANFRAVDIPFPSGDHHLVVAGLNDPDLGRGFQPDPVKGQGIVNDFDAFEAALNPVATGHQQQDGYGEKLGEAFHKTGSWSTPQNYASPFRMWKSERVKSVKKGVKLC